ncbi:hypothetical protein D3C81_1943580 [compost metagenome]
MRLGTFKIVAVARFEDESFQAHHQFKAAFEEDAGLFAIMGEHFFASIGTRRIDLVEKGNSPARVRLADQFHGHRTVRNVDQFVGFIDDLGRVFRLQLFGKELDHGHWNTAQHLAQRAD